MSLKIAVYGSLRAGMGNNRVIDSSKLLSSENVSLPFEMIDLGSFPGLIKSNNINDIYMEIYEVDPTTYQRVERLEGYPSFYDRELIETSAGAAEVYFLPKDYGREYERYPRVTKTNNSYDWVNHIKRVKNSKFNQND